MSGPFNFADTLIAQGRWKADQLRQDERMNWEREERARAKADRERVDGAFANLQNVRRGLGAATPALESAGYTPEQVSQGVAAQGGAQQFLDQAQRFAGDLDNRDIGADTAPKVAGLRAAAVGAPRDSQIYDAMMSVAEAQRAVGAMPGLMEAKKGARYSEAQVDAHKQFKDWANSDPKGFASYLEELSENAGVRGGFSRVKGSGPDGKFDYITYNPDGKGNGVRIDMDDAAAIFAARQAMEVDPARAMAELRGLKKEVRSLAMSMLDVQFKGAGLNNDVTSKLFSQDMAERKLAQDAAADRARINLGYAGLNQRAAEMDRTHPMISAEDRKALLDAETAWRDAKDPKAKAEAERQYQIVASRVSINQGKVLGLPSMRQPRPEIKEEDLRAYITELQNSPAHKNKNVFELRRIALAELGGGGDVAGIGSGWGAPAESPKPAPAPARGLQRPASELGAVRDGSRVSAPRHAIVGDVVPLSRNRGFEFDGLVYSTMAEAEAARAQRIAHMGL